MKSDGSISADIVPDLRRIRVNPRLMTWFNG